MALNGSTLENLSIKVIDALNIRHLSLAHLVNLDLSKSNISDVRVINQGHFPELKFLSFRQCTKIIDSRLTLENFNFPKLGSV